MPDGARFVTAWLRDCAREFDERVDELNELDRVLGDGDHGTNLRRGMAQAGSLDIENEMSAAEAIRQVGMALVSTVGGSAGPLFGSFFLRAGAAWPSPVTTAGLANALEAGLTGVVARGRAVRGDKTMVDALEPAVQSLKASARAEESLAEALQKAAWSAEAGAEETRSMVARRGRAHLRAEESVGVLDPGAVSMALILRTAAKHIVDTGQSA